MPLIWLLLLLVKVERETIDKLDELICEGRGDDQYKQLFATVYVLLAATILCAASLFFFFFFSAMHH